MWQKERMRKGRLVALAFVSLAAGAARAR